MIYMYSVYIYIIVILVRPQMINFMPDTYTVATCKLVWVGAVESKPNGDDTG